MSIFFISESFEPWWTQKNELLSGLNWQKFYLSKALNGFKCSTGGRATKTSVGLFRIIVLWKSYGWKLQFSFYCKFFYRDLPSFSKNGLLIFLLYFDCLPCCRLNRKKWQIFDFLKKTLNFETDPRFEISLMSGN